VSESGGATCRAPRNRSERPCRVFLQASRGLVRSCRTLKSRLAARRNKSTCHTDPAPSHIPARSPDPAKISRESTAAPRVAIDDHAIGQSADRNVSIQTWQRPSREPPAQHHPGVNAQQQRRHHGKIRAARVIRLGPSSPAATAAECSPHNRRHATRSALTPNNSRLVTHPSSLVTYHSPLHSFSPLPHASC
jgi:hypothetical protein